MFNFKNVFCNYYLQYLISRTKFESDIFIIWKLNFFVCICGKTLIEYNLAYKCVNSSTDSVDTLKFMEYGCQNVGKYMLEISVLSVK
jgi:hypothetical protein